jgi:pyruvate-formate lyase-activating enzyme
MPVEGLLPFDFFCDGKISKRQLQFVTFSIPAPHGCDLRCPHCFVSLRREVDYIRLIPAAYYTEFIRRTVVHFQVCAVSIQGYEPLLPDSHPYTQAILATARLLGIPTGLVTNGTHLSECAEWLATLAPTKIAVSLDAAAPAIHDRLRGKRGAWAATVAGIKRAVDVLAPRTKIAVASVLFPGKTDQLLGMPSLLRSLKIDDWIVTPLQKVGRDAPGGPVTDMPTLYRDLARLQDAADAVGMPLTIDDELDCLGHERAARQQPQLRRFRVRTIPNNITLIRMGPDGACSVGRDILRRVTPETPRWSPDEDAGEFLERLLAPAE